MKILVRNDREGEWREMTKKGYSKEAELQQLLMESPDLIPMEEITGGQPQVRVFIPEFGLPGSGASDLIGVDELGNITIVECKLAANPEVKRKVIGQVLEYAAFLWQTSYEAFDARVAQKMGNHLAQLVADSVSAEEWSEEDFRREVSSTLAVGNFHLIIAVDTLNEELRRTIEYLNSWGAASIKLYALEARYFADRGLEILVPHLYGAEARRAPGPPKAEWDEDRFFRVANEEAPEAIPLVREIFDFIISEAEIPKFGLGTAHGNLMWRARVSGKPFTVFSVSTLGGLALPIGSYPKAVTEGQREGLRERLNRISGLTMESEHTRPGRYPTFFLVEVFREETDLKLFRDAIRPFLSEIKEQESRTTGAS